MIIVVPQDLSKVNIVVVPTTTPYQWCWRIYAPPGTIFDAGIALGNVPTKGVGAPNWTDFTIPSEPEGVLIVASIAKHPEDGYVIRMLCGGSGFGHHTELPPSEFLEGGVTRVEAVGRNGTEICDYDKPIILLRHLRREHRSATRFEQTSDASGLLFWLTPKKTP